MIRAILLATACALALPAYAQTAIPVMPVVAPEPAAAPPASAPPAPRAEPPARRVPLTPAMIRVRQANRAAAQEPRAQGFIHGIQIYPYSDGALYHLYAAPERVTDIALQPGETLVSVAAGDTARWTVGDTSSGSGETRRVHILVKPFAAGLATNLIITTDRRVYRIQLKSNARIAMAALAWSYPADALLAVERTEQARRAAEPVATGLAIERLDFAYVISGDRPAWRPVRAFDDGRQTYVEFPASIAVGEAPPLFVIGEDGEAALVNYRVAGRFYIVDRLFEAAELRLGAKRQAIVRIAHKGRRS